MTTLEDVDFIWNEINPVTYSGNEVVSLMKVGEISARKETLTGCLN